MHIQSTKESRTEVGNFSAKTRSRSNPRKLFLSRRVRVKTAITYIYIRKRLRWPKALKRQVLYETGWVSANDSALTWIDASTSTGRLYAPRLISSRHT